MHEVLCVGHLREAFAPLGIELSLESMGLQSGLGTLGWRVPVGAPAVVIVIDFLLVVTKGSASLLRHALRRRDAFAFVWGRRRALRHRRIPRTP
jgi:hypothetical protein